MKNEKEVHKNLNHKDRDIDKDVDKDTEKDIAEILKSELEKEAQEILAEIEADESLKDLTMPEEAEEELLKKIQKLEEEKAAYEHLSEKDKEALRLGREIQIQQENKIGDDEKTTAHPDENVVTFKKKKRRTYLLIALVAVFAMMLGMTAVGEVPLVTEWRKQIFGSRELMNVNSEREAEEKIENTLESEVAVYKEIKETFQVDIIKLAYMPDEMGIIDYEIDEVLNRATILYQCDESIMEYQMVFNYRNQSCGYAVEDELLAEKTIQVDDTLIQLQEYRVDNSTEKTYIAQFVSDDVHYTLNATTTLPEEEIEKILKKIKKF